MSSQQHLGALVLASGLHKAQLALKQQESICLSKARSQERREGK